MTYTVEWVLTHAQEARDRLEEFEDRLAWGDARIAYFQSELAKARAKPWWRFW